LVAGLARVVAVSVDGGVAGRWFGGGGILGGPPGLVALSLRGRDRSRRSMAA